MGLGGSIYNKDDTVYAIYDGKMIPVVITGVFEMPGGSIKYTYDFYKYLETVKLAEVANMLKHCPIIPKGFLFPEYNLFKSYNHLVGVADDLREVTQICKLAEEEI
jgi:hypothetical protein